MKKKLEVSSSIYGFSKIHKLNVQRNNLSLRPIVSSIGTNTNHFFKLFTNLIDLTISTSHCTKDSLNF